MLVKSKVKYIQSLSHKKQRDQDGVFVAEGPKIINELLTAANAALIELYAVEGSVAGLNLTDSSKLAVIDEATLEKISFLSTPNQVLGIFRKPVVPPLQFDGQVVLMLDNIQDPGNLGSIIRCADWFGIKQVVCSPDCADVFGPKTVQSTMGSIARVNIFYHDLPQLLATASAKSVYAATLDGMSIYEVQALTSGVIIIGNESKGISKELLTHATERLTIPGKGNAESLNAAVATGIILSHLVR